MDHIHHHCFQSCVSSFLQQPSYLDESSNPNKSPARLSFVVPSLLQWHIPSLSPGCDADPHLVPAAGRGLVQSQPRVVSAPVLLRPLSGSRAPTPHPVGTPPAQHRAVSGWEGDHRLHGHWITQLSLHYQRVVLVFRMYELELRNVQMYIHCDYIMELNLFLCIDIYSFYLCFFALVNDQRHKFHLNLIINATLFQREPFVWFKKQNHISVDMHRTETK